MKKIIVLGLGPGAAGDISVQVKQKLQGPYPVYLRTKEHPIVTSFADWDIRYQSFDNYYNQMESFEEVYEAITDDLLLAAQKNGPIIYAVPGSPLVAETSVSLLRQKSSLQGIELEILPAISFLDSIYSLIDLDPVSGLQILDALGPLQEQINTANNLLVCQVYSRLVASDLKLQLLEYYPADFLITVIRAAGIEGLEKTSQIALYQLDHLDCLDHLTSVYLPSYSNKQLTATNKIHLYPLDPLVEVVERLLGPEGCPWDKMQTHQSLKSCLIEECYEVIAAIDNHDPENLCEELGDLLLQIVFHSILTKERGDFDLNQVIKGITKKMIRRHPHIFGDLSVFDADEVLRNWEMIKAQEKGNTVEKGLLDLVPRGMPALLQAYKIQEKAAGVGFDWPDIEGPWGKVFEEIGELKEALKKGELDKINSEFGDLLFALVNLARFLKITPEDALLSTIRKFRKRFAFLEQQAKRAKQDLREMSLSELDTWWELAKKEEI